jgi:ribose transport system substrate-binding protein
VEVITVKKVLVLGALISAVALASGCGDDDDAGGGGGGGGDSSGESGYSIAAVTGIRSDPFHIALACGAQDKADELGVDLNLQAPTEYDPAKQIPMINAAVAQGPDALVVAPTDGQALIPPLEQAKSGGAEVVLIDTLVENPEEVAASAITEDYLNGGRQAADEISELVGGKGKVLLIAQEPGVTTQDDGTKGFEEGIAKHPDVEYLGTEYDGLNPTKTAAIVSATLAQHPDLAGIVTLNGPSAPGVVNALRRADKLGELKYVSFDATPELVDSLKAGEVDKLLFWKPYEIGAMGIENAVKALDGEPVEKLIYTGPVVATKETVDDPEVAQYLYKGC